MITSQKNKNNLDNNILLNFSNFKSKMIKNKSNLVIIWLKIKINQLNKKNETTSKLFKRKKLENKGNKQNNKETC